MVTLNQIPPEPIMDSDFSFYDHDHDADGTSTVFTTMTPASTTQGTAMHRSPPPYPHQNLLDVEDPLAPPKLTSSVPWPGNTYILRSSSCGRVLTLLNGTVLLTSPSSPSSSGHGSYHWSCVESKGWLGFRNPISGKFLGHDGWGNLVNRAGRQQGWENFCARLRPDGGYVLLMTHFERLWQVGIREVGGGDGRRGQDARKRGGKAMGVGDWQGEGEARLAKMEGDGIIWEFIKVE